MVKSVSDGNDQGEYIERMRYMDWGIVSTYKYVVHPRLVVNLMRRTWAFNSLLFSIINIPNQYSYYQHVWLTFMLSIFIYKYFVSHKFIDTSSFHCYCIGLCEDDIVMSS
jgi:hypothetical protein